MLGSQDPFSCKIFPKKYVIEVIGCRTNQYEVQLMRTELEAAGYSSVRAGEEASICVINTCAVTESAESSSRHTIRSCMQRHKNARIVVTGCLAEKDEKALLSLGESIYIIPNSKKESFSKILFSAETTPSTISTFDGHTRPFIKIQDGCTCFCSYCIVPYLRGGSRSRNKDEIVQEIRQLIQSGYKEVVLTGVNVGDFSNTEYELIDLIREIDLLPGLERLRLSSINPNDIDSRFVRTIPSLKKFCPSLHLVLQSGSNAVLRRMRRKYTREMFFSLVDELRQVSPDFEFSTDVIVGFPGETESDFEETLDVIQRVRFSKVHMFPFSVREGTAAARFQDKVGIDEIKRRKREVLHIAEKVSFDVRQKYVGKEVYILTERGDDPCFIYGQTPQALLVKIPRGIIHDNEFVKVKLIGNDIESFSGEICEPKSICSSTM
jgi:threonylcarbamoyladenosine tRNA methylthiotransferase MtaB